eukprot:389668_1
MSSFSLFKLKIKILKSTMLSLFVCTILIIQTHSKPLNQSSGLGVYNGKLTRWVEAPYMASIRRPSDNSEHCCAATIISLDPPVVLTAAHCVTEDIIFGRGCGNTVEIGCDEHTCSSGYSPVEYTIENAIIHPYFHHFLADLRPPLYDIAVVKLDRIINAPTGVTKIEIQNGVPCCENYHPLSVYGYGRTRFQFVYGNLTNGTEEYYRNDECNSVTNTDYYTDESMICFMDQWDDPESMVTVCGGDNGGPVISHRNPDELGILVGVISWEWSKYVPEMDCVANYPQTAANVGLVYEWIMQQLEKMK